MPYDPSTSTLRNTPIDDRIARVLCLDGGGAKGFYNLGVLKEIEALLGCPLCKRFDLIFGTSTGAIIAALLALGYEVDEVHALYKEHVPTIMKAKSRSDKSAALATLAKKVFEEQKFDAVLTGIGIVTTNWANERPKIFKGHIAQAHGRQGTFEPGFGVTIGDAVQASCSAYPFFDKKVVVTSTDDRFELVDGGYCANNPTLYAIADATIAMEARPDDIRVISIGVGEYPTPKPAAFSKMWFAQRLESVQLLQKTLEINTQSMDQLRAILYTHIKTVRISDAFTQPEMATDLFEHDLKKLGELRKKGRDSFASREQLLRDYLGIE